MVRTQIQLTEAQALALRRAARSQGVSMAEIVRRCVEAGIATQLADRAGQYERAARLVGAFQDRQQARDVSAKHDKYLDGTYG